MVKNAKEWREKNGKKMVKTGKKKVNSQNGQYGQNWSKRPKTINNGKKKNLSKMFNNGQNCQKRS